MFCGYGCIQCAPLDAITCVLCIVYAVSKSDLERPAPRTPDAMLAAYYGSAGRDPLRCLLLGQQVVYSQGLRRAPFILKLALAERRRLCVWGEEAAPVAATSRLEDDGFAAAAYADVEAGAAP